MAFTTKRLSAVNSSNPSNAYKELNADQHMQLGSKASEEKKQDDAIYHYCMAYAEIYCSQQNDVSKIIPIYTALEKEYCTMGDDYQARVAWASKKKEIIRKRYVVQP